jgi:hypothetical protein
VSASFVARALVPGERAESAAEAEELRTFRLEAEARALRDSMEATQAVRADLADGRLSLAQALATLRALDAQRPAHLRMRADSFPGATEEQRFARMVITQVYWHLKGQPRQAAVLDRLEDEFQALFERTPRGNS